MVHTPEDRAFADLETIEVKDRKDRTGLLGVNVLDRMPRATHCQNRLQEKGVLYERRSWARLGLAITDHTSGNKIGIIHHGTEGHS